MPIFPQKVLSNTPQAIDHNRGVEALKSVRGGRAPGTLMRSGPLGTQHSAKPGGGDADVEYIKLTICKDDGATADYWVAAYPA